MNSPKNGPTWRAAITVSSEQVAIYDDALSDSADGASIFEVPDKNQWLIEVYFELEPDRKAIETRLSIAAAANGLGSPRLELDKMPDIDWVQKSLEGLVPVEAGRFYVYGSHNTETAPVGSIRILIEAGPAFGTGQHETTKGCLHAIDEVCRSPIKKPLDVGTGTGVLAIAMAKALQLPVLASDIDPVSVEEAAENARKNKVGNFVTCIQADGLDDPQIQNGAPFDLVIANILANPLVELAADIASVVQGNGRLILSGLLDKQRQDVLGAYTALNFELVDQHQLGEWPTLVLKKLP